MLCIVAAVLVTALMLVYYGVFGGIADIALYAYTCVAPHGGIALDAYPALRDWLARVEATPGFVPLPAPDAAAQALIDQS